jgi:hypothetical protein
VTVHVELKDELQRAKASAVLGRFPFSFSIAVPRSNANN